jgi:hypothetical protein
MHYCVYVFIPKEGDIEVLVAQALAPFDEDRQVPPYKSYLDAGEVKAMAKHYRVKPGDLGALTRHMEDWKGCPGGMEGKRLFAVKTWNPAGKWDWYEIGGRWDARLRNNAVMAKTLLERPDLRDLLPFALVTPDGLWQEREALITQGWMKWRVERKTGGAWRRQVRAALRRFPDRRVVCVDVHS